MRFDGLSFDGLSFEGLSLDDPSAARTAAEFNAAMRRLKDVTGLSYRVLERRARQRGMVLPRSTLTAALSRDRLPREELVVAFMRACGCDERQSARWLEARRRLAFAELGAAGQARPARWGRAARSAARWPAKWAVRSAARRVWLLWLPALLVTALIAIAVAGRLM